MFLQIERRSMKIDFPGEGESRVFYTSLDRAVDRADVLGLAPWYNFNTEFCASLHEVFSCHFRERRAREWECADFEAKIEAC